MINNKLLFWSVLSVCVYWIIGLITPKPFMSSVTSLMLLLFSAFMLWRYSPAAYDVLFHQKRDKLKGGEGSHLGVYGAALIAAGSCYVGIFGLLWVLYGQPESWLGTVYSGFGRAVAAAGFLLMAFSPTVTEKIVRPANVAVIAFLIIIIAIASFFAGTRVKQPEQAVYWKSISGILANRPVCAQDQPVWGSQNGVYHVENSPHRNMVAPRHCFASTDEAEENGFRAPKGTRLE